jgi:hypothetical protein
MKNNIYIYAYMGTFAERAIVDYRLLFAGIGKQTSVFRFRLKHTNGSMPFLFSVCIRHMEVAVFRLQYCPWKWI